MDTRGMRKSKLLELSLDLAPIVLAALVAGLFIPITYSRIAFGFLLVVLVVGLIVRNRLYGADIREIMRGRVDAASSALLAAGEDLVTTSTVSGRYIALTNHRILVLKTRVWTPKPGRLAFEIPVGDIKEIGLVQQPPAVILTV